MTYGLSFGAQAFIRDGYAVLQVLQIVWLLPHVRRFFCSETFGGYASADERLGRWQNPTFIFLAFGAWLVVALAMLWGSTWTILAATLINVGFARYFYITTRHTNLLNGIGAVGRINHWLGFLVFFLQLSSSFAGGETLRAATLWTFRVDFALIISVAGLYKFNAGYRTGNGLEWAIANPRLSKFATLVRRVAPDSVIFTIASYAACIGEMTLGALLLVPTIAPYSAALLASGFVFLTILLRLGFLGEMVIVCCALFTPPGSLSDTLVSRLGETAPALPITSPVMVPIMLMLAVGLVTYLCILPFAYAGIFYNFYGKRRLPPLLQNALNAWMIFFSLNIWRVVTVDYSTFFFRIHFVDRSTGKRTPFMDPARRRRSRFQHIGEFASLSAIFAILKYDPENYGRFQTALLRYCASVARPSGADLLFEYVSMTKGPRFLDVPVAVFVADCDARIVTETTLSDIVDVRKPVMGSRIMQSAQVGTYMPKSP